MQFHYFSYQKGQLFCEDVPLSEIASQFGTPTYVYSKASIKKQIQEFKNAFSSIPHRIAYAVKANSNLSILGVLQQEDCHFDIVSGGELLRVLEIGDEGKSCFFSGVGKTDEEIALAIKNNIYSLNIESEAELYKVQKIAESLKSSAPIALRVNPEINEVDTHNYTITAKNENKFGIPFNEAKNLYLKASKMKNIQIIGFHFHIGSQIINISNFKSALKKVLPLVNFLKENYDLKFLSIGGGLGIPYENALESGSKAWWKKNEFISVQEYAKELLPLLKEVDLEIVFEPGRYLVANSGVLLAKCLYEKENSGKKFKILDAGMNDLIRPALYDAHHQILPLEEKVFLSNREKADLVGPVCETGDFFCQNQEIYPFQKEDLLAVMSAGAYCSSMSSNYNSRYLPTEILVEGKKFHLIRQRQSFKELIALEKKIDL